jgi:phosphatidylserine/phosphatidylglycerophosphate/cardiolipin synthase-like enzyme
MSDDPEYKRWYQTDADTQPLEEGNHVTPLVNGAEAFASMAAAIETATGGAKQVKDIARSCDNTFCPLKGTDYIYLLNWWVDLDLELRPRDKDSTLKVLLMKAVARGVQVRAMFWDQVGTQNTSATDWINEALDPSSKKWHAGSSTGIADANGAAILDNNTLNFGAHHQKILVVKGKDGLIGFCGGVDFNRDRIQYVERQPGSPMHDVHCCIRGPAARGLLKIFCERWTDHPDGTKLDKKHGGLRGENEAQPPAVGDSYVQIGRTYGNGLKHAGIKSKGGLNHYSFCRNGGEQTARRLIFHAIEQAKHFIYVQDQYLCDFETAKKLREKLKSNGIRFLIILIPHPSLSDHPHIWRFQKRFLDYLGWDINGAAKYAEALRRHPPVDPDKGPIILNLPQSDAEREQGMADFELLVTPQVIACFRGESSSDPKKAGPKKTTSYAYVHSKMWIMDDKFTIIGSANCNPRGYTHDSEVVAGIYNESLAKRLRMRLWRLHLGNVDVTDPIESAKYWLSPDADPDNGRKVALFDQDAGSDDDPIKKSNVIPDDEAEPNGE